MVQEALRRAAIEYNVQWNPGKQSYTQVVDPIV